MAKEIIIIAGPNGAGKTTTAKRLLDKGELIIDEYINADEIARGLAPLNPESVSFEAGKLLIKRFDQLLSEEKSFAYETTGASKLIKRLAHARSNGYKFHLFFLWLSSPDLALERVSNRVKEGGHFIPDADVIRRYQQGIKYLIHYYLPLVDSATILDNSIKILKVPKVVVIAKKALDDKLIIVDKHKWTKILGIANAT